MGMRPPDIGETPDFIARAFIASAEGVRRGRVIPDGEESEAADTLARVIQLAERHEPEAYKVARRCAEIYDALDGAGATYFLEHTDAILEGGEGLMPNPDSRYFTPLFVEAVRERDPQDKRVRRLLDLIKRVDEGVGLNALYAKRERESDERAEASRPKDARIVDRLSEVIADPKREDDHAEENRGGQARGGGAVR